MAEPPLMLFDGHCNFCGGSVRFVLRRARLGRLRFCAMQTPVGQAWLRWLRLPLDDADSVVLVEDGKAHLRTEALLRIAREMDPPWPLIARLIGRLPRRLLDWLYDRVATNRYRFAGRTDQCLVPEPWMRERFVVEPPVERRAPVALVPELRG